MHIRRLTLPPIAPLRFITEDSTRKKKTKRINQYLLLSRIGRGSSCKVYIGLDANTRKYYAVKVFSSQTNGRSTSASPLPLEREARIMRMVQHPNIVELKEALYAPQKGESYLVTELGNCGSLKDLVDRKEVVMDEKTMATIFKHIVTGLGYLHSQGFVHQDIKPSNILMFGEGLAKIGDFGIGHSFQSAGTVVGSPAYQAPEVFEDEADENGMLKELDPVKEDVWSLGITMFECIFKELPFKGENVYEITRSIRRDGLVLPYSLSTNLEDLICGMLRPDPKERLSLEQIMAHPFFAQAGDTFNPPIPPMEMPSPNPKRPVVQIIANEMDNTNTAKSMRLSSSWSGMLMSRD